MGAMYDLANTMATIAKAEGITMVLVLRKDGTFQMTLADPEIKEDHLSEGSGEAV